MTTATTPDDLPPMFGAAEPDDAGADGHEVPTELADLHALLELDNAANAAAGLEGA